MEYNDVVAAMIIQKWYRKFKSRQKLRQLCYWKIRQSVEYDQEHKQQSLQEFLSTVLEKINTDKSSLEKALLNSTGIRGNTINVTPLPEHFTVNEQYTGPRIENEVTADTVQELIQSAKDGQVLHPRYVCRLITEGIQILKRQTNVREVSSEQAGKVTVVGGLRGSIEDLITILNKNKMPSLWNPYIFCGDYVDGGNKSLQVLTILLALLIVSPEAVTLLRGRHEDTAINLREGLYDEVCSKYQSEWVINKIFQLLEELYSWLCLAVVVDTDTVVVSGGVSKDTDLEVIKSLDRSKYKTLMQMPQIDYSSTDKKLIRMEWQQLKDLIWSQPRRCSGYERNNADYGGFFGPDVLQEFLNKNNFKKMIQSSIVRHFEGYKRYHEKKCISLLSISDFDGSNHGVYLILEGNDHQETVVQFKIHKKTWNMSDVRKGIIKTNTDMEEEAALRELQDLIASKRSKLNEAFYAQDNQNPDQPSGYISKCDWSKIMSTHCSSTIPWTTLCDQITTKDPQTYLINYISTFHRKPRSESQGENGILKILYPHKENLRMLFKLLDRDNSGQITKKELVDSCSIIAEELGTPLEESLIENLAQTMDVNKDAVIDFNEFLEAYRNMKL